MSSKPTSPETPYWPLMSNPEGEVSLDDLPLVMISPGIQDSTKSGDERHNESLNSQNSHKDGAPYVPATMQNFLVERKSPYRTSPISSEPNRVELIALLYKRMKRLYTTTMDRPDTSRNFLAFSDEDLLTEAISEESLIAEKSPGANAYNDAMVSKIRSLETSFMNARDGEREKKVAVIRSLMEKLDTNLPTSDVEAVIRQTIREEENLGSRRNLTDTGASQSLNTIPANPTKTPWICEICYASISTQRDLIRHKESQHKISDRGGPVQEYQCVLDECKSAGKIFNRRDLFRAHVKRIHPHEDFEELCRR